MSLFDLENDLPDELIPNGDLGMMSMPSNGDGVVGGRMGGTVPDAAAKHKQLSQLLQAGPGMTGNLSSVSPQPGMGQLSTLGKSPMGQGSPSHQTQPPKTVGTPTGQGNNSQGMGLNAGFNQAMMNNNNQAHGLMGQNMAQQGQMMNGVMGPAGRGRAAPGMQYQGQAMQGAPVGGGAGPGVSVSGSVLAETLTQGAQQMGAHNAINPQQAGNMNKVSHVMFNCKTFDKKSNNSTSLNTNEQVVSVSTNTRMCGFSFSSISNGDVWRTSGISKLTACYIIILVVLLVFKLSLMEIGLKYI